MLSWMYAFTDCVSLSDVVVMVILSPDLTSVWLMVGFSVDGVLSAVKLSVVWAWLPALSVAIMLMLCNPSVALGTAYLSIQVLEDCFLSFRVFPLNNTWIMMYMGWISFESI